MLRVDPNAATAAFDVRVSDDELGWVIFAGGRGMLGYWVLEERQVVALYNVTWLG